MVLSYLPAACLAGLRLYYGVEVECCVGASQRVVLTTRLVSYTEVRYLKQTWRSSTSPATYRLQEEFIYHENFPDCSPGPALTVRVWTIVSGQLISCEESRGQEAVPALQEDCSTEAALQEDDCSAGSAEDGAGLGPATLSPVQRRVERAGSSRRQAGRAASETNLTTTARMSDSYESLRETFSRKANNRKSLPVGHLNLGFVTEEDCKDPYLVI